MREIYLDNSATTRTDERVAQLICNIMVEEYGNPSSLHQKGLDAQLRLEEAQKQVAALMGAQDPQRVLFTSGGTESNNLAIFGGVRARQRRGKRIITTAFEHSSVLGPFAQLEEQGFEAVYIQPDAAGRIDPQAVVDAVNEDTIFVSVMMVNNEVGTIQPVAQLAQAVKEKNPQALFHCDGVQAFGKLPIQVGKSQIDLLSVSGHKIHAPKGVGALYVKKGVRLVPLLYGGSQQQGLRPGTENLPLACGMGLACQLAGEEMAKGMESVTQVRDHLVKRLSAMEGVVINSPADSLPYILNLSAVGYRSEVMLHFLESQGIYVSSASACTKNAKSHVLEAMGLAPKIIDSALRISFQRSTTLEEVDAFADALALGMSKLAKAR